MRFRVSRRKRRLLTLLIVVALVLIALSWSYTEYQAQRAKRLLAEAALIRIGDSEASIQPVLRQFGGGICVPSESPEQRPKENWTDEAAYEHWLKTRPDCTYYVDVDPWGFSSQRFRGSEVFIRAMLAMWAIPGRLRSLVAMRDWNTAMSIAVRGGRVTAVHAGVYLEGRDHWLGHHWELLQEPPYDPYGRPPLTYTVDGAFLSFPRLANEGPGDTAIENHLTADADKDQVQAAQTIDMSCLTRALACKGMCDLSTSTIEYLKQNPDASRGYIVPKCQ